MLNISVRSKWIASSAIVALLGASGAEAATLHRLAVSSATGSGGATTFLQSSASGGALQGEVATSARTNITIPFGVLGEYDAAGSAFGTGVLGIATTGYGVGAESLSATQPSFIGINTSGGPGGEFVAKNGGDALDVTGVGGAGIYATSDTYSAISGYGDAPNYAAIYAEDDSAAGYGAYGNSFSEGGFGTVGVNQNPNGGVGVGADSESATQGLPALQATTGTDGTELFDAGTGDNNTGGFLSISTVLSSVSANGSGFVNTAGVASSDLQINGDIYLSGAIFTQCGSGVPYATSCGGDGAAAKQKSSTGTTYAMYTAEHASKTVEDEGEAALRGGVAHVTLDPAFASVISKQDAYLVFTTPQGDTRGLYVTNRTPQGFDVRETSNGHSSLTFDYRIVAHPFGARASRMSVVRPNTRANALAGRPAPSRALAAHNALFAHMLASRATHKSFASKVKKIPASLVAPGSFTSR